MLTRIPTVSTVTVRVLRLVLLLVVMVATSVVASAGAAQARAHIRPDPHGDMSRIGEDNEVVAVPQQVNGDITRTVFRHRQHRVRIRIGFAALQRTFESMYVTAAMQTNKGRLREAVAAVDHHDPAEGGWRGNLFLRNGVRCSSLHHSFDYTHDVLIIGVPRRCLGNPRWVRISVVVLLYPRQPARPKFYRMVDNALRGAADATQPPPLSPPIFRG